MQLIAVAVFCYLLYLRRQTSAAQDNQRQKDEMDRAREWNEERKYEIEKEQKAKFYAEVEKSYANR